MPERVGGLGDQLALVLDRGDGGEHGGAFRGVVRALDHLLERLREGLGQLHALGELGLHLRVERGIDRP